MMHRLFVAAFLVLGLALHPTHARAAEPASDIDQAREVIKQYLDTLVRASTEKSGKKPKPVDVAQRLQAAKKFIHPKTLEVIAKQEKNKDIPVSNGLGVWALAKTEYWLTSYEIVDVMPAVGGTFIVEAKEKNWRVQEKGLDAEAEPVSYLIGRFNGKWYVTAKLRNESFTKDGIRIGYKGYFDPAPPAAQPAPDAELKPAPESAKPEPRKPEPAPGIP